MRWKLTVSSGKSSKKGGGGGSSSSSRGSSASTSAKSSSRLPPIPHQETPSWQKPITNFFHSGPSSSKKTDSTVTDIIENEEVNHTKTEGNVEKNIETPSNKGQVHSENTSNNQKHIYESSKESNPSESLEVGIENDQVKEKCNENDIKEKEINLTKPPDNQMCSKVGSEDEGFKESDTSETLEDTIENDKKEDSNENDDDKENNMNQGKQTENQIPTKEHLSYNQEEVESNTKRSNETEEPLAKKTRIDLSVWVISGIVVYFPLLKTISIYILN